MKSKPSMEFFNTVNHFVQIVNKKHIYCFIAKPETKNLNSKVNFFHLYTCPNRK